MRAHRAISALLAMTSIGVSSCGGGDNQSSGLTIAQAAPPASVTVPAGASVNGTVTLTTAATSDEVINVAVTSAEVYPRTGSVAIGIGQLTFNLLTGAVTGTVTFTGISAIFADIHEGIAGTNGPAILTLAQSGSDPNSWRPATAAVLTPDQINALLAGELYKDAHSIGYPEGEIRGQLLPQGIEVAVADMNGASVVPPVPNSATGFAAMTIYQATATATVHIQTTGVDDATAAAVGNGAAGQTASAPLFSLMKDPTLASHWFVEGQSLTAADLADLAAGMLYVDVLTPEAPAGALRGQLSLNVSAPSMVGSQMPLGGAPLDPALLANVRAWITEGAQNN